MHPAPIDTTIRPRSAALVALRDLLGADDDLDDAVMIEPRARVEPVEVEVILHRRGKAKVAARRVILGVRCG